MQTTKCPVCNSDVVIDDEALDSDMVECVICETKLEVHLHPLRLTILEEES